MSKIALTQHAHSLHIEHTLFFLSSSYLWAIMGRDEKGGGGDFIAF